MGASPDNVLNRDMWNDIVRLKGRPWAEQWRAQNNLQVEGMPQHPAQSLGGELPPSNPDQPPVYQPLDAAQPQGVPTMDETEDSPAPEAGLDALAFANMTPGDFSRSLSSLYNQASKLSPAMGQTDYEAARQKIAERRYGPSRAEQLFALSAALAKPTYAGNRFGQILGNVAPALADTERARREATEARETALEQLKQQYLTGQNATERQKIEAQLGVLKTAAPVIAAKMKPQNPWSGATFVPGVGWVPRPDSGAAPVAVGSKTVGGQLRTIYSDGSFSVNMPNGQKAMYGPDGKLING